MATTNPILPPVPYTKSFAQIVSDFAAAAQGSSETPIDFDVGSVFLALAEATAGNADWLQKLYLFALLISRLQTSQGLWVDSWTADYMPAVAGTNSPRLPANNSSGGVTFSRFAPQSQAVIPVGTLVAAPGATPIVFQVYADPTNAAYNATIIPGGGFVIPAGQGSISVNVQALGQGTIGNVLANSISVIQSSVVGVDTVTNPAPFINGLAQESDAALKARFKLFIASLRAGTVGAIGFAITSLQQGLQYTIHENVDPNGDADNGAITVYVDDGSGNPPVTTVQNASTAVNGIRAAGVRDSVVGASILSANISLTISIAAGYNIPLVIAAVQNAVGAYVNNLGLENPLPFSMIEFVAYSASPGVTNVTNTLLNSATADLIPGPGQTVKVNTAATSATGSIAFTSNPANNTSITLDGTAVTFVTSGATGNQVNIGTSLSATLIALQQFLVTANSSPLNLCSYTANTTTLNMVYANTGISGNAFTLATNVVGATVSAPTLAGGTAASGIVSVVS